MIARHQVDGPCRTTGGTDQQVASRALEHRIDTLAARESHALLAGTLVGSTAQCTALLRLRERLLPEPLQLAIVVLLVPENELGQRMHRDRRRQVGQVCVDARLELVQQHFQLLSAVLVGVRHVCILDDDGAPVTHQTDGILHQRVDTRVEAEVVPCHTDAQAAEAVDVERAREVSRDRCRHIPRRRVQRVATHHAVEQQRRVAYGARHGARRVLTGGNRNDAGSAHESHGRLQAHDTIERRRADH